MDSDEEETSFRDLSEEKREKVCKKSGFMFRKNYAAVLGEELRELIKDAKNFKKDDSSKEALQLRQEITELKEEITKLKEEINKLIKEMEDDDDLLEAVEKMSLSSDNRKRGMSTDDKNPDKKHKTSDGSKKRKSKKSKKRSSKKRKSKKRSSKKNKKT